MKPQGKQWLRYGLLAIAGAVTFYLAFRPGEDEDSSVVQAVARNVNAASTDAGGSAAPRTSEKSVDAPDVPTRSLVSEDARTDPFAPRGWTPPPPPPPPPAPVAPPPPPPPPEAPPIPFKFIGQIEDKSAKPAAFITKGEALFVVHVGDVVENTYRVESFNSAQVVVTYLPLKQRQTIDVSGG